MSSLSKIFSALLALSTVAIASPIQDKVGTAIAHVEGREAKRRVYPEVFTIFPTIPDLSGPAVDGIHLEVYKTLSQVEQVVTFKDIPATAKNCYLHLHVADKPDRIFLAKVQSPSTGDSLVTNIHRLTAVPPEGQVSYRAIQGLYNENERFGAFEFSGWDISSIPKTAIANYPVPCSTELYFRLSLRQLTDEKSIYLHQNEQNGLFVEFES